ncbi:hypothetical protein ABPG75_009816 [Micractinium tetrahymenae]
MMAHRGRPGPTSRLRSLITLAAAALLGALSAQLLPSRNAPHAPAASCVNKPLLPIKSRVELGELLEKEGFSTGAELGVQRGEFSKTLLDSWRSCKSYLMVDAWQHQENYNEAANVDDAWQQQNYELAQQAVAAHAGKARLLKMYTSEAAKLVADASLDFVYIDARHDFCGAAEDIALWWPKVMRGGILAGHDYLNAKEIRDYHPDEDWGLCGNGRKHDGAVKAAVAEFAAREGLTVAVTYREWEQHPYATWMVRKPTCQ